MPDPIMIEFGPISTAPPQQSKAALGIHNSRTILPRDGLFRRTQLEWRAQLFFLVEKGICVHEKERKLEFGIHFGDLATFWQRQKKDCEVVNIDYDNGDSQRQSRLLKPQVVGCCGESISLHICTLSASAVALRAFFRRMHLLT